MIWFILACYGLTQVLVYGSIFNSIRPKHHFFHCPMCMGFWTGVFILFISSWSELFTYEVNLVNLLIMGWLSAGTSYFLDMIVDDDGFKITRRIKND